MYCLLTMYRYLYVLVLSNGQIPEYGTCSTRLSPTKSPSIDLIKYTLSHSVSKSTSFGSLRRRSGTPIIVREESHEESVCASVC